MSVAGGWGRCAEEVEEADDDVDDDNSGWWLAEIMRRGDGVVIQFVVLGETGVGGRE